MLEFLKAGASNLKGLTALSNRVSELSGALEVIKAEIEAMLGKLRYMPAYDFGVDTPSQQDLTDYALAHTGLDAVANSTSIVNLFNGHEWIYNEEGDEWVDLQFSAIGQATNTSLGVVQGSLDTGMVAVDLLTGKMFSNMHFDLISPEVDIRTLPNGYYMAHWVDMSTAKGYPYNKTGYYAKFAVFGAVGKDVLGHRVMLFMDYQSNVYMRQEAWGTWGEWINISSAYSLDEIPIGTWIDGKTIYRKVFTGTIKATANVSDNRTLMEGVDTLIGAKGSIEYNSIPGFYISIGSRATENNIYSYIFKRANGQLQLFSMNMYERNDYTYFAVVEYTKI